MSDLQRILRQVDWGELDIMIVFRAPAAAILNVANTGEH
jgi:hypothetical protein